VIEKKRDIFLSPSRFCQVVIELRPDVAGGSVNCIAQGDGSVFSGFNRCALVAIFWDLDPSILHFPVEIEIQLPGVY